MLISIRYATIQDQVAIDYFCCLTILVISHSLNALGPYVRYPLACGENPI